MLSVLFVPFYVGELGWEIINYIPHVNHFIQKNKYDEVHVVLKKHHEALYPMGTHFYTTSGKSKDISMGNSGGKLPSLNYSVLGDLKGKKKKGLKLKVVDKPPRGIAFYKKRSFVRYKPSVNCKFDVSKKSVVVCVRGRSFGKHKNWSNDNWKKLCDYLLSYKLQPVLIGVTGVTKFDAPSSCLDLRDKTTLQDVIDVMHQCRFVIGQSTGTTHLAALCGVYHAVWGSKRIQERYLTSWNPFNSPVEFYACHKEFILSADEAIWLAEKMINRTS